MRKKEKENLNNTIPKEKTMLCFKQKFNSKTLTLAFFSHRLVTYQIPKLKIHETPPSFHVKNPHTKPKLSKTTIEKNKKIKNKK
jgi:hypothetical protein